MCHVLGRFSYFLSFPLRMNLCTTVTESDVARGKNALKASLVGQLNGTSHVRYTLTQTHTNSSKSPKSTHRLLSSRNNTDLRWHRQTRPKLWAPDSSGRVGRPDRCEWTLGNEILPIYASCTIKRKYCVFKMRVLTSLRVVSFRPWPPGWCETSAPNISTINVLLWQLSVSSGPFRSLARVPAVTSRSNGSFLAPSQQVPWSSCPTTTECAVPCTGWGFKMRPVFAPHRRPPQPSSVICRLHSKLRIVPPRWLDSTFVLSSAHCPLITLI